jgi:hypothetical protein
MDEDGEASAEEGVVAEQNHDAVVEATTTNTPTKRTWPWPMATLSSIKKHLRFSLCSE